MHYRSHNLQYRAAALLAIVLFFTWAAAACAAEGALATQIDALLADPNLDHGIQGVVVKSLKTGAVLYERNADITLIPASNMKLLVSAAALDRLGPAFTFRTEVLAAGNVRKGGVLSGDLVIKGEGDPTLSTGDLAAMAKQVKASGIAKVTGNLVVDDSAFDNQRLGWGWSWDDEPYYYSAQISALNLNRNTVDVYVQPGKTVGAKALVRTEPATNYMTIESTAVTGKADSTKSLWVYRKRGRNVITVSGSIPLGSKVTGPEEAITMEEPALYVGDVFKTELARAGVQVVGKVLAGKASASAKVVASATSPPMSEIIALLNKPSDNLIAEVLLKTLGLKLKGKGSTEAGAQVEAEFLEQAGLDMSALRIVDGSGLSRLNLISARNLLALLEYMHKHKHAQFYIDSLPVAGVDGTLRNRMKGTPAEANVQAKTGYVSRVSSLSGYVKTKSGEPLAFSIVMNNHLCANTPCRTVQDNLCRLLAELP